MKNKATTRNIKITKRKKLTGKGKYIIKVGNHPHIKIGWLKDKSSKIICIHNKQLKDI